MSLWQFENKSKMMFSNFTLKRHKGIDHWVLRKPVFGGLRQGKTQTTETSYSLENLDLASIGRYYTI